MEDHTIPRVGKIYLRKVIYEKNNELLEFEEKVVCLSFNEKWNCFSSKKGHIRYPSGMGNRDKNQYWVNHENFPVAVSTLEERIQWYGIFPKDYYPWHYIIYTPYEEQERSIDS